MPGAPGTGLTRELTSGSQGATHNPVFSKDGKKVAWTEMARDGYEADRYVVPLRSRKLA